MRNMMQQTTPTAKVVMLGNSEQGKSAIVLKFVTGNFIQKYDPTIEDIYQAYHVCDNERIILDILDTSGLAQDREALGHQWIYESDIFLLVYAVNSTTPLDGLSEWRDMIVQVKQATGNDVKIPIVLVANKCDTDEPEDTIATATQKGQQLADDWDCPFVKVSARSGFGLDHLWDTAVRQYLRTEVKHEFKQQEEEEEEQHKCLCCTCFFTKSTAQSIELKDEEESTDGVPLQLGGVQYTTSMPISEHYTKKRVGDKIKLYNVHHLPRDDTFEPIISSKNYEMERQFGCKRFFCSILCGLFLPFIIVFQTIVFCAYKEEGARNVWYLKRYPLNYAYDDAHYSIFKDFLGLMVGREPQQDPETVRNRKWFLRQSATQLCKRIVLTAVVLFMFCVLWYNVLQSNNDELLGVSNMETFGVFVLYWVIWILLSLWIATQTDVYPRLPLVSKLRSIDLYFGCEFNVTTSAYKIIRGYLYSENKYWAMPWSQKLFIFLVALAYALLPGITRCVQYNKSGDADAVSFVTHNAQYVEIGALLVNFMLIAVLLFIIESQYSRHFGNYKKWMTDLTMILSENQRCSDELESARNVFCSELFLSLERNSNALGWLEIRSFMAVKGMLFFGEQELPILWILFMATGLTAFIVYRVYFIEGNALESVVFNGVLFLTILCLILLLRISSTSLQFQSLQSRQERLVGQQKFFMKCRRKYEEYEQDEVLKDTAMQPVIGSDEDDDDDYKETNPLIGSASARVDNASFLQDMLYVISKVDIYPRLFQIRLAPLLTAVITLLGLAIVFIIFKIFLDSYALKNAEVLSV